jgi:hypothetical protein
MPGELKPRRRRRGGRGRGRRRGGVSKTQVTGQPQEVSADGAVIAPWLVRGEVRRTTGPARLLDPIVPAADPAGVPEFELAPGACPRG